MANAALDTKAVMASAIFVPIPAIDFSTAASDDREPRLRSIIASIEQQNSLVRRNILRDALARIAAPKAGPASQPLHGDGTSAADFDALTLALRTPVDPNRTDMYKVPRGKQSHITAGKDNTVATLGLDAIAVDRSWTHHPEISDLLHTFNLHHAKTLRFYREALQRTLAETNREPEGQASLREQVRLELELDTAYKCAVGGPTTQPDVQSDIPAPDTSSRPIPPTAHASLDPRRRAQLRTRVPSAPSLQSAPVRSRTNADDTTGRPSTGPTADPRVRRRSSTIQLPPIAGIKRPAGLISDTRYTNGATVSTAARPSNASGTASVFKDLQRARTSPTASSSCAEQSASRPTPARAPIAPSAAMAATAAGGDGGGDRARDPRLIARQKNDERYRGRG